MRTTREAIGNAQLDVAVAVGEADRAFRDGRFERALELYLEAAAAAELPAGNLCVKIARCHDHLDSIGDAFSWLARVVDAPDSFLDWSAAASTLERLSARTRRPDARRSTRVALTGSYTTNQLTAMLPLAALRFGVDLIVGHEGLFAQFQQDLIDPMSALYACEPELIVIAVHEGALHLPPFSEAPEADVARELERWQALWEAVNSNDGAAVVQHTFARRPELPLGLLSAGVTGSRYAMVEALNRGLHRVAGVNVSLVDCDRLAAEFGRERWFDDRYWFRSRQAVALEALPMLARHTATVVASRLGLSRKCLVLDLDNTLWGGVIGEDGLTGIALGGRRRRSLRRVPGIPFGAQEPRRHSGRRVEEQRVRRA